MAPVKNVLAAALTLLGTAFASPTIAALPRQDVGTDGGRLEVFQVAQPVLGPDGPQSSWGRERVVASEANKVKSCEVVLMEHSFGFSYEKPFIGEYTPPDCDFNRVIMNFTVVSAGRQFDRLALMYFGDTEVWRTSTAEPRRAPGIIWTYWKDMTEYLYFWRSPQKLIFDLGNLVDDMYTGAFNTTLTATFFVAEGEGADEDGEGRKKDGPADLIIPISARRSSDDKISAWNVPDAEAKDTIAFPRNARRAVFSVSGNGQIDEEFWALNLPQSDAKVFESTAGVMHGLSPWREVQVLLDGQMVGAHWPFPVLFTGAMSPSYHRPIVGINTFDLREHEIDITPWLPVLCNGEEHTFEIRVAGIDDTGEDPAVTEKVASYWVITGKIFVWLDEDSDSITTGEAPRVSGTDPQNAVISFSDRKLVKGDQDLTEALHYTLQVSRDISVDGTIVTQAGEREVSWQQSLRYTNSPVTEAYGLDQRTEPTTSGRDASSSGGMVTYASSYAWPLRMWAAIRVNQPSGDFSINSTMYQALDLEVTGDAVFPSGIEAHGAGFAGSRLRSEREGDAYIYQTGDGKNGFMYGRTDQRFSFEGLVGGDEEAVDLYTREVSAQDDVLTLDRETMGGKVLEGGQRQPVSASGGVVDFAADKYGRISKILESSTERGLEVLSRQLPERILGV